MSPFIVNKIKKNTVGLSPTVFFFLIKFVEITHQQQLLCQQQLCQQRQQQPG